MQTLNWRISKHISAITENKIIIPLAADTHDPTRTWKKRPDFPWTGSWVSARMLVLLLSKTQWNSDNVYQCYFLVASFILCNQSGRIPPCLLFPSVFADSLSPQDRKFKRGRTWSAARTPGEVQGPASYRRAMVWGEPLRITLRSSYQIL